MFRDIDSEEKISARKFSALRSKTHIPPQLLDLVERVAAIQNEARRACAVTGAEGLEPSPVDQVIQGKPLVARQNFPYDAVQARELFTRFLALLTEMGGPMAQAVAVVNEGGEALMLAALEAFRNGDNHFFSDFAAKTPQAPRTLDFLAQCSMTPSVMANAAALAAALPERTWDHAACPVCGSLAFQSSLREKEGLRVHCCSFCRAEYRTLRMQCAYCEERDPAKLPYFTADEEPGYRVDVCETCKGYIKTTDFREFDRPSLPALDDLESMALDILAHRRGYMRPTPSAWGF